MADTPDLKRKEHPWKLANHAGRGTAPTLWLPNTARLFRYAELEVTSNFTFLSGASAPDELVRRAAKLEHAAVAITDTNTLAGVVRAHVAAKAQGIPFMIGCRLVFTDPPGLSLLVYPTDRTSYGRLCRLLTLGKRRAPKGQCHLVLHDLIEYQQGLLAVVVPPETLDQHFLDVVRGLKEIFAVNCVCGGCVGSGGEVPGGGGRLSVAASCRYRHDDRGSVGADRVAVRICGCAHGGHERRALPQPVAKTAPRRIDLYQTRDAHRSSRVPATPQCRAAPQTPGRDGEVVRSIPPCSGADRGPGPAGLPV